MIDNTSPISSAYGSAGAQTASTPSSSTSDLVSSFKEIMSVMMAGGSMTSTQEAGAGMSQMMMPLMLLLLEKLVENGLETDSSAEAGDATGATSTASHAEPSGKPVEGAVLTQEFHTGHTGIDLAVPTGTKVKSTMDGKVIHAGWNEQGYGNLVIVENGAYRTYYAHLSSIPVSVGDEVKAGTVIGLSGSTGNSTGPHLHYEIRENKVPTDPGPVTL